MPASVAFYDAYAALEGSGRALLDIVAGLDRERYEPVVVCPRHGQLVEAAEERGYRADVVQLPPGLARYGRALMSGGLWSRGRAACAAAKHALQIRRWLLRNDVRVLHCNQTRAILEAGAGARLARVPVLWNVRIQEPLPRALSWHAGACADVIVPLSLSCMAQFSGKAALLRKAEEIPLGIRTDRFSPETSPCHLPPDLPVPGDRRVILTVGTLHPRKRQDLLLEALPAVLRHIPRAHLVIVGGTSVASESERHVGEEWRLSLARQATRLGLDGQVTFAGRREDVPTILRGCETFVLPSEQEGTPSAVLEAMSTAKPCVVTEAAAANIEHDVTGIVVPDGDAGAIAAAIASVLGDDDLAQRLGAAARQYIIEHHSLQASVCRYEAAYERLLTGRGRLGRPASPT